MKKVICVVDNRTFRKAQRQVAELEELGEHGWAHAGAVAITHWCRMEARIGPKRHRVQRAADLEYWEAEAERLHLLNLAGYGLA